MSNLQACGTTRALTPLPSGGRVGAPGRQLDTARKRELAIEFIRRIRSMDRDRLHELILRQAGEELAQFFLAYATDLMARAPGRAAENAASLLLIGYLIRCYEEDPVRQTAARPGPL